MPASGSRLPRILLSVPVMAGAAVGAARLSAGPAYVETAGFLAVLMGLLVLLAVGLGSYFGAAQLTGAFRLSELKRRGADNPFQPPQATLSGRFVRGALSKMRWLAHYLNQGSTP